MDKTRLIKKLRSELAKKKQDLEILEYQAASKQKEASAQRKEVHLLEGKIEALENEPVLRVSEHALVRYMERVLDLNIEEITAKILSDDVKKQVELLGGTGKFVNGDGFRVVIKDHTVVTIEKRGTYK